MEFFGLIILSSTITMLWAQDLQNEDRCTPNLPKSNISFQQLVVDNWYVQSTNIAPSICTTMQFRPHTGDNDDGFLDYTTFQGDKKFKGSYFLENVNDGKYTFYSIDRNSNVDLENKKFNSNCSISLYENDTQMFILACIANNLYYFAATRQQKVDNNTVTALETKGMLQTNYTVVNDRFIVQVDKCFNLNSN